MCDYDKARRMHGRARAILLVLATFATALLFGCMPYELRSVLDGPQGKALSVSPSATVVIAGSAISLKAVGGVKPYTYALVSGSSTGTLDTSTGVFTSTSAGSAVIRVTDKTGKSVDAKITIQPVATGLAISPLSITLSVGASVTFVPIGGTPTYSFAITTNNSGALPMVGAVYIAGPTAGVDDTVTLTDSASATATATVHVVPISSVNYAITGTAFSGTGTVSTALPGGQSFTLENIGSSTGTSADWKVYLSANALLDGGDFVIASGTVNNLSASGSVNPTVTGTFPAVAPGAYFLIAQVTSADDTTPGNNTSAASPITMNPKNIDYAVGAVSNIVGLTAGAGMTGDFNIENQGTVNGSATVFWQVRASVDPTLDATDYIIAGGNIPGGLSSGVPTSITFSGTWPSTPGTWHLFEIAVAVDDINNVNDVTIPPTSVTTTGAAPANVEYQVTSVSNPPGAVAGDALSGTFDYTNNGTDTGAHPLYWTAYVSADATLQLGTDTVIDSGSVAGPVPSTGSVPFTGTWPAAPVPGTWHLIVSISSSDDIDTTNNITSSGAIPRSAPDVNYDIISVSHTTGTIAGGPFLGTVEIKNIGGHAGTQIVPWRVYVSTDAALQIGTDVLVATGFISSPGLISGDSRTPTFSGTWPSSPVGQLYYLIVEVAAGDDVASGNNIGATLTTIAVAGVAPDYTITSVPLPAGATTSQSVSGTFTVQNGGNGPGVGVSWQVYASLGNSLYDVGDTLLATGSTGPIAMSNSASPDPAYAGTWPAAAGNYYIVVRLSAADDATIPDVSAGPILVSSPPNPDYKATFNTALPPAGIPWSGLVGTAMNPTSAAWLNIINVSPNLGHANVTWAVYLSTNNVLDIGDTLVQQGTIGPLPGLTSSPPITFGGNWPAAPGQLYFMIATVQAADDANVTNDIVIAAHPSAIGDYRYVEAGENNGATGPGPNPVQTSDTGVASLGANQTIAIEGVMDAYVGINSQYDTYLFTTNGTMSRLSIRAMWGTGWDDIDLYLWDDFSTNLWSRNVGINAEPGASNFDITAVTPRNCYISANSWLALNTSGSAGQKYVILVRGLP